MQKLYSASRTSVLTYGVLLVALILSIIPEAAFVTSPSSGICGPIASNMTMYDVVSNYIGVGNPENVDILELICFCILSHAYMCTHTHSLKDLSITFIKFENAKNTFYYRMVLNCSILGMY